MIPPLIRLENVDAGYGDRMILQDCSLMVWDEDFLVLRGRNGGGKTTLLKVLAGLLPPMQGKAKHSPSVICRSIAPSIANFPSRSSTPCNRACNAL